MSTEPPEDFTSGIGSLIIAGVFALLAFIGGGVLESFALGAVFGTLALFLGYGGFHLVRDSLRADARASEPAPVQQVQLEQPRAEAVQTDVVPPWMVRGFADDHRDLMPPSGIVPGHSPEPW
jgi:hypothetical protein